MFTGGGTVVARYDYDPYGRSTTVLGTTPTDFNFTGLYRHSKSNLDLAVYRAYDSDLGRWLNRDPLDDAEMREGPNLYVYVRNNVINHRDPSGLQAGNPNFGNLGGIIGNGISKSVIREIGKPLAECEKTPHSPSGCCKCCVISVLAQPSGSFWPAKDGWGKVYDKPCEQLRPEFMSEPPWMVYWGTKPW